MFFPRSAPLNETRVLLRCLPPPEDTHNRRGEEVIKVLLLVPTPRRGLSVTGTRVLSDLPGVLRGDGWFTDGVTGWKVVLLHHWFSCHGVCF